MDSIPLNNTSHVLVNILPGNYVEIVNVSSKNNITFRGAGRSVTTVGYPNNNNINGSTHIRMAFKVNANDIAVENLTVTNSTPQGGSQAEALMIEGNNSATAARRFIANNVTVSSFQDTILANINASQGYFYNTTVRGNYDYVWGGGNLFFTNCTMHTVAGASSYNLTASRTDFGTTQLHGQLDDAGWHKVVQQRHFDGELHARIGLRHPHHLAGRCERNCRGIGQLGVLQDRHQRLYGPRRLVVRQFNFWQCQNTDLSGHAVTFTNVVTVPTSDARMVAATNAVTWLNGWLPQLLPNMVTNPISQSVSAGGSVTFISYATGIPDPTYQWLKNGTPITGAMSASYSVTGAVRTNGGNYARGGQQQLG